MHDQLIEMLRRSAQDGVGIGLYLSGHMVPLVVTEFIGTDAIVGRNQEYDTILVRLADIEACAMN